MFSLKYARGLIIAASVFALACAGAEQTGAGEESGRLVMGALQAELVAAVCFGPNRIVDTLPNTFFPKVVLLRGTCPKEHGGTASRVAGIDSDGVVYTLDSEGAFQWLLSRHRPSNLDSGRVIEYAHLALRLMGRVDARAQLINEATELPPEIRSGLSSGDAKEFPGGIVEMEGEAAHAWVATYDGKQLIAYQALVSLPSGDVVASTHVLWTAPRPPLAVFPP